MTLRQCLDGRWLSDDTHRLARHVEAFPGRSEAIPGRSEAIPGRSEAIPERSEAIRGRSELADIHSRCPEEFNIYPGWCGAF